MFSSLLITNAAVLDFGSGGVSQTDIRKKVDTIQDENKRLLIQPVEIAGRKIFPSFWGKGWCSHMDSFHDYENRLMKPLPWITSHAHTMSICAQLIRWEG